MYRNCLSLTALAACLLASPALAQDAQLQLASESPAAPAAAPLTLLAGTVVMVAMDADLSTMTAQVGDRFNVTVVNDVVEQDVVIIPKGTAGYGEVTFATRKGGFGKQGILGIALRYLDLNGRMVALDGRYREEGRSNDGAAAATMFAVGIFAVAVKGKSAVIPQGRELKARTGEDITFPTIVVLPDTEPAATAETRQSTPN